MFSFIITHRNSNVERELNLHSIIKWIGFLKCKYEIIVIEQDDTSKISNLSSDVNHIFAYNPHLFSKAWGMNIGIRKAKFDTFVFQDSDCFFEISEMNSFLTDFKSKDYEWGSPNKYVYTRLTKDESIQARENIMSFSKERPTKLKGTVMTGGIFAAKKNAIYDIKWWDEDFIGWGGEDSAIASKLGRYKKRQLRHDAIGYHLWHPSGGAYVSTKEANAALWRKRYCGSNSLISLPKYLSKINLDDLGDIHKYEH